MLVVIIGFVALAVDGGMVYAERRRMQTAADAGALAGAAILLDNGENAAKARAVDIANANGASITVDDVIVDWGSTYGTVTADTTITVNAYEDARTSFAQVLGINNLGVAATAVASFVPLGGVGDLLPIAIEGSDFEEGVTYKLWESATMSGAGNFGWVDFREGANSTVILIDEIDAPEDNGFWMEGDWVSGLPGENSFPQISKAMDQYAGQEVTIIVYELVQNNGAGFDYQIAGFARFKLDDPPYDRTSYDVDGDGKKEQNVAYIQGQFVGWVTAGGTAGTKDYGTYTIYLSQ